VDAIYGLRVWPLSAASSDYVAPGGVGGTLSVSTAGAIKPIALTHRVDAGSATRVVTVKGASQTRVYTDGTGKMGESAYIVDATLVTTAAIEATGRQYLQNQSAAIRGTFSLEDTSEATLGANDVMRRLDLTAAAAGIAITFGFMTQMTFTFYSGKRNVAITYGGKAARASGLIRSLTRSTLS
jgi:hypothetical protein